MMVTEYGTTMQQSSMVQSQCKRKQSVCAWIRCSSSDNSKEEEKENIFLFQHRRALFVLSTERMGLHVFLLHLFSILYTLSLCDGNVPFVLACRAMLIACVHARAVLLLNNLLCFLFLRSFVLSFVLFFFLSLFFFLLFA